MPLKGVALCPTAVQSSTDALAPHWMFMSISKLIAKGRDRVVRKARKYRARWQERLRPVVLESRGVCPICERTVTFTARDAWLRDHYKCGGCRSIPRERALMLVVQQQFPNWRELKIHESSPGNRGASKRFATECPGYVPTQFFSGQPPGSVVNGVRCENLERLTFADESVDLHITQDVFEHVLRPAQAFAEVARTLKPGGAHIFTVPIVNKDAPTRARIALSDAGEVAHLEPPEYHGNPIDAKGALVTFDWGYDIREFITKACGLDTQIIRLDDISKGIRAEYIEVLVTKKPSEAIRLPTASPPSRAATDIPSSFR
jgi:SAM-dependent methyltransferase